MGPEKAVLVGVLAVVAVVAAVVGAVGVEIACGARSKNLELRVEFYESTVELQARIIELQQRLLDEVMARGEVATDAAAVYRGVLVEMSNRLGIEGGLGGRLIHAVGGAVQ